MKLSFPLDAVVVVAGVPGAGKTTLIRRAVDRRSAVIVDTDDQRAAGRRRLLNAAHYARIVAAIAGRRPVVIHSRGTHAIARRTIALLARIRGRPAHLVLLDVPRTEAGLRARGRSVGAAEMQRQVTRWTQLMAREPGNEGWASVTVLERARAARTQAIEFIPAAGSNIVGPRWSRASDAAAGFERLRTAGVKTAHPLRVAPSGQRRFGLHDPAGACADVVEPVEPELAFWDRYVR